MVEDGLSAAPVNWQHFADGRWWELKRGIDFQQTPRRAMMAARMWAHRRGYRFHCHVDREAGMIQLFIDPNDDARADAAAS